jgi:FtsP/CotA-like multicopper oxidase with cupredoxin domain
VEPISRRRALTLGGLGVASTVIGGAGLVRTITARFEPAAGAALVEPPMLASTGGRLQLRLEASEGPVTLAGRQATALRYNGGLPGPTLRLQPGDRLQIELINRLGAPTNLHLHGLHVSPDGNGDNVFVTVEPGESFDYDHRLPEDHPPGVYWYHPHHHGMVADQISGGLYGAIIVGDPDSATGNNLAPFSVTRARVLVVSDISLDRTGSLEPPSAMERMMGREGDLVLVNGQVRPRLDARPGERERWRIVNACVARYLRLRLDGQHMRLLGIDSGRLRAPREVAEVLLVPGNRADLLVTTNRGSSQLRALQYDRGTMMGMMGSGGSESSGGGGGMPGMGAAAGDQPATGNTDGTVLATLAVTGRDVPALPAVPAQPEPRDLRRADVANRRKLTFAMGMGLGMGDGAMRFTIDGKRFDPDRVDQTVAVGTVEEWTLTNSSPMDHPVHLHVWPMQLVARGGRPLEPPTWQDVVNVPARSEVTVRVAFDSFTGRTVYHCHILDHEDNGMMGVIVAS